MENALQIQKICLFETKRVLFVIGIIAITIIQFQSLILPHKNVLFSVYPDGNVAELRNYTFPVEVSSPKSAMVDHSSFLNDINMINSSVTIGVVKNNDSSNMGNGTANDNETEGKDGGIEIDSTLEKNSGREDAFELDEDMNLDEELPSKKSLDMDMNFEFECVKDLESDNKLEGKAGGIDSDSAMVKDRGPDDAFKLDEDTQPDEQLSPMKVLDLDTNFKLEGVNGPENGLTLEMGREEHNLSLEHFVKSLNPDKEFSSPIVGEPHTGLMIANIGRSVTSSSLPPLVLPPLASLSNASILRTSGVTSKNSINSVTSSIATLQKQATDMQSNYTCRELKIALAASNNNPTVTSHPVRKKMRCMMPPKSVTSISEMNRLLLYTHASPRSMRPRWASVRDKELASAKSQILNAPAVKNDQELYAPLYRNVSMFKRSYELMERILKVYIYKEGNKPVFHQPILKGIYSSEGWFMKLMETNKQFVVRSPKKAHLFYMPFSSRMLQYELYVRNSHGRQYLAEHLKRYTELIAARYRFWNRTGGTDHFLVGCHDWAPYETRHHMERCIKALCNADVTGGFKIGRDVSLAQSYVRFARNPLRDVGGKPPSKRATLAFFAGSMHGYLRPILLKYWENKDLDMKIFGPMRRDVAGKMNYIQHMKSSKYCICAKGYEVNSPRVVEAIFYECVPVIISDNFVPPLFEVLDWDAFSVIVPEKDIPNLKEILLSIPEEKYIELQLRVKKVQKHFLWHIKPVNFIRSAKNLEAPENGLQ
ncbi:probable glycosyltransferase At5g03795 isoform X2 [Macadamia integrifolia]|uniref:probable glycosyltransferase At5g03795 isoform X2 n=1 Tax=Macadamia integrifolia TaxID=60698 RepID=UPI001C4EC812|nr:probable glycosyltransferase At5g03795 isoform X2 [Macadamia integrifolia]